MKRLLLEIDPEVYSQKKGLRADFDYIAIQIALRNGISSYEINHDEFIKELFGSTKISVEQIDEATYKFGKALSNNTYLACGRIAKIIVL